MISLLCVLSIFLVLLNYVSPLSENVEIWLDKELGQPLKGDRTEVILFMGETGNGKSSLASLLTDVDIVCVEVNNSGEFILIDSNKNIGGASTINSKTFRPNFMRNNRSDFYDCPGFSDTRGEKMEILTKHAVRRLVEAVEKVKFVFVANHVTLRFGMGDRRGFMDLVKYATRFIKNINVYRNGIALIVTKVQNSFRKYENGTWNLVNNNEKTINAVAKFLTQTKMDLEEQRKNTNSRKENELIKKYIKFIDILVENDGRKRIGILHMISESGHVRNMQSVKAEKKAIETIIDNLAFIPKKNDDFDHDITNREIVQAYNLLHNTEPCQC